MQKKEIHSLMTKKTVVDIPWRSQRRGYRGEKHIEPSGKGTSFVAMLGGTTSLGEARWCHCRVSLGQRVGPDRQVPQPSQPQHNAAVPLDRVYSLERGEWRSGVRQGEVIIANCSCAVKRKERESGGQEVTGKHKKYEKSGDKGKHEASVSTYKELYYSALLRLCTTV